MPHLDVARCPIFFFQSRALRVRRIATAVAFSAFIRSTGSNDRCATVSEALDWKKADRKMLAMAQWQELPFGLKEFCFPTMQFKDQNRETELNWTPIEEKIRPSSEIIEWMSRQIHGPIFCDSNEDDRGYRFSNPALPHFCLLKLAKATVTLRSALCVAKAGFYTEVATLIRVFAEASTYVEWALSSTDASASPEYKEKVRSYVEQYFADVERTSDENPKALKMRQKQIHDMQGEFLDNHLRANNISRDKSSSDLLSSVYIRFSKYVHAAYPETVDLYGARTGELSLTGGPSEVKDQESFEILENFAWSLELSTAGTIVRLFAEAVPRMRPEHQAWLRGMIGG